METTSISHTVGETRVPSDLLCTEDLETFTTEETSDQYSYHGLLQTSLVFTPQVLHLQMPAARTHSPPLTPAREWDPHRQLAPASAPVQVQDAA